MKSALAFVCMMLLLGERARAVPARVSLRWSQPAGLVSIHIPEQGALELRIGGAQAGSVQATVVGEGSRTAEWKPLTFYRADLRARRTHGAEIIPAEFVKIPQTGGGKVFIPFSITDEKRGIPRARSYEVLAQIEPSGAAKVLRLRRIPLRTRAAETAEPLPAPAPARRDEAAPETLAASTSDVTLHLELRVDVDSRFYKLYRADTAAIVALVLQRVNEIYTNQLGIEIRMGELTIFSDPGNDPYFPRFSNSNGLLEAVRALRLQDSGDLKELFTSARGFLDAIGLSFIGTVCQAPDFSFAWEDYASGFDVFVQTVAHETGHGFGASHDKTDPHSLMSASNRVNVVHPYFSPFSINEITAYLGMGSACLDDVSGSEIPAASGVVFPTTDEKRRNIRITIAGRVHRGKGTLGGTVSSIVDGRLAGRVVELRRASDGKLLATTLSDRRGGYSFSVKLRQIYFTDDRMSQRVSPFAVRF
jgi:hypothetical protein